MILEKAFFNVMDIAVLLAEKMQQTLIISSIEPCGLMADIISTTAHLYVKIVI